MILVMGIDWMVLWDGSFCDFLGLLCEAKACSTRQKLEPKLTHAKIPSPGISGFLAT
ncbi:hypothetical protein HMPREF9104_03352 [Lentilactobacillus kisonensis F0435]|uniref:Uncharacterized protein n=1 Tax=Lentilactobacillus kisonensis F0435 TaxID=797516 RepID=H1LL44_9LACO|nr:hypothetical protein HMPREF9104_03352 [Lentilactobacillus kisonensis F0435]